MRRFFTGVLVALLLLQVTTACEQKKQPETGVKKLRVITTLFPIYDFTRAIGGDRVDVTLLLPPGVEPHNFEPKPDDVARISTADLFVYTNRYMEPWAADILKGAENGKLLVVDAGAGVALLPASQGEGHDDGKEGEKGHRHETAFDPHIWLSIPNAEQMVDNITAGLTQKDPANSTWYRENAADYKRRLAELDARFTERLSRCQTRIFLHGGHSAFDYLANRYGLTYLSAYAVSASAEPTPRRMIELVDRIRANNLHAIFYEELISPTVAETIARETGATLLKLHGIHNVSRDDMMHGVTYLSLMDKNLDNLSRGLECR